MTETTMIFADSPEAATQQTVTGWVSRNGLFYGKDEAAARYAGSTHARCACGTVMDRGRTMCEPCGEKARHERYKAMPFEEWDGTAPLYSYTADKYFWNKEEIIDYCDENPTQRIDDGETIDVPLDPAALDLVICEAVYFRQFDADDYFGDELPEDQYVDDVWPELAAKIAEINAMIGDDKKVISWQPGAERTTVAWSDLIADPMASY